MMLVVFTTYRLLGPLGLRAVRNVQGILTWAHRPQTTASTASKAHINQGQLPGQPKLEGT